MPERIRFSEILTLLFSKKYHKLNIFETLEGDWVQTDEDQEVWNSMGNFFECRRTFNVADTDDKRSE
jgi:hypothetical protein